MIDSDSQEELPNLENPSLSEVPVKAVEVLHYPDSDIVLNNSAKLSLWGPKLADAFQSGVPKSWEPVSPAAPHVVSGVIDGKRFAAKTRLNNLSAIEFQQLREIPSNEHERWYSNTRTELNAFSSITSEMYLASAVQAVVSSPHVQDLAHALGFEDLTFVEPILGVVSRNRGAYVDKIGVYDYIPEAFSLDTKLARDIPGWDHDGYRAFEAGLIQSFTDAGINPADLNPKRILLDRELHGFLIDSEGYTKSG
jgi:hypothetical protein